MPVNVTLFLWTLLNEAGTTAFLFFDFFVFFFVKQTGLNWLELVRTGISCFALPVQMTLVYYQESFRIVVTFFSRVLVENILHPFSLDCENVKRQGFMHELHLYI